MNTSAYIVGRTERLSNLLGDPEVRTEIARLHRDLTQRANGAGGLKNLALRSATVRPVARKQMQRRLDEEAASNVVQAYISGATVDELAEQHDINRKTVSAILRRHGVSMRRQGLTESQVEQAVELYSEGWSFARIGDTLEVWDTTVRRALLRVGISLRDESCRDR